jgi:2-(1,2-epoxy-1,2-dihydrophenyl)acetyl-CoA isomerase
MRRAQELMLTNRTLSAADALAWGLVTKVVPDAQLAGEAKALARALAAGPTRAFGTVKSLLAGTFSTDYEAQLELEARGIAACAGTPDGREGIRAYVEKRSCGLPRGPRASTGSRSARA